ncbi:MAG: UDP-glucose--hexose-1-phosphate uridylyltransferase [Bacteroidota bacterium]
MTDLGSALRRPHRRLNPLTGEWVLVSPQRSERPWGGKLEAHVVDEQPSADSGCYLCPGNVRASGVRNPDYKRTFVFDNDFGALLPTADFHRSATHPIVKHTDVQGVCRVVCFSPRHDLTLPRMKVHKIRAVIDLWADQIDELGKKYSWVQIFENKGEMMGCSNPHPHCQIWASTSIPNEPAKEDVHQRAYWNKHGKTLLQDYMRFERRNGERVLLENPHWSVVVPFWAEWPFETLLLPKRHVLRLPNVNTTARDALADILQKLLVRYDNLFDISFPYTMGWHGAPFGRRDYSHWQLHAHVFPPLLRSAAVKKFMVGYELLAEPQRDITPEQAAERLKNVSDIHYLARTQGQGK